MRLLKSMLSSACLMILTATTAMAAPMALLQDSAQAPVKVDVHTTETHTVWYTDPMWLAIGGLVVLIVIVLAVLASKNRDSTTTVIR